MTDSRNKAPLTYVVSIDLDCTLINTLFYGHELTEELITLAFYCHGTDLPFFITTNRYKRTCFFNLINAAMKQFDLKDKNSHPPTETHSISYAITKLEKLGLNVKFCTLLEAAHFKDQSESKAIEFKESVIELVEYEKRLFEANIFGDLDSIKGIKNSEIYNALHNEAISEQKSLPITLSPHKKDHFYAIGKILRGQKKFENHTIHILHIDDDKKIVESNNGTSNFYGNNVKVKVFHIEVNDRPKDNLTGCIPVITVIADTIGLRAEAEKLLDDGIWSNNYLKDFALVRFLLHVQAPLVKFFTLITRFEDKYFNEISQNEAQVNSWSLLKNRLLKKFMALSFYSRLGMQLQYRWENTSNVTKIITISGVIIGSGAMITSVFVPLIPLILGGVGLSSTSALGLTYSLAQKAILGELKDKIIVVSGSSKSNSSSYSIIFKKGITISTESSYATIPSPSSRRLSDSESHGIVIGDDVQLTYQTEQPVVGGRFSLQ